MRGLFALGALCASGPVASFAGARRRFRVGMSTDTLAGANVNDARAAYRVWSDEIAHDLDLNQTEMIPEIFVPSAQMIQMIRNGEIDCFAISAWEYAKVIDLIDPTEMAVENYAANGMEYILLVHAAGSYQSLADLRGAKIVLHHHRDTLLVEPWLNLLLTTSHLATGKKFFDAIERRDNLTDVVVPLFFRRTAAVALTRRSFNIAAELNPQLSRDLKVLAVSPRIIPDGFFFRRGSDPQDQRRFRTAMDHFAALPAGKQCLALYQSTGFVPRPCSVMKETLDLLHQIEHIPKNLLLSD